MNGALAGGHGGTASRAAHTLKSSSGNMGAHTLSQMCLDLELAAKEGDLGVAQAIYGAGFSVVQAHPVKAEMSGATPKSQAKEPIQLDIIFVCQKREQDPREPMKPILALEQTATLARDKLDRLRRLGLALSQNDCRVTVVSQFLALLGPVPSPQVAVHAITSRRSAGVPVKNGL